jgi:adenosylhomocysteine nucleosidase
LLAALENKRQSRRGGRDFWSGELLGHRVVVCQSRIGKVAAAATACTLIEHFGVTRIVFTGVAGGLGDGVNVGDVVIARGFVQHDMDASPLFPRYQIPLDGRSVLPCDPQLFAMLFEATNQTLAGAIDTFASKTVLARRPSVHLGLVASGDRFVSQAGEAEALKMALAGHGHPALAVEMEGAAVAQVALDYGIPFAAMRTISDQADAQAHVDFPRFLTEVASRYATAVVSTFLRLLPK